MGVNSDVRNGSNSVTQPSRGINSVGNQSMENRSIGTDGWRRFGSRTEQNQTGAQNQTGMRNQPPARGALSLPTNSQVNSPANSTVRGDVGKSSAPDNGGWRRFSDSSPTQRGGAAISGSPRGTSPAGEVPRVPRPETSVRQGSSGNDESWRHFTPQPRGTMQDSPSSGSPRGLSQDSSRGYSRPPLEMRQPIVTPRASEANGAPSRGASPSRGGGGYGNGGGYSGGGGHSQPSGGGGHSQPSGGGGNHGGSGGGGNHGGSGGGGSPRSGGSGHRH
jgi:hypothetical protein